MRVKIWLLALVLSCQPAMAAQRVLLIRGLMDYMPGVSPMTSLKSRLEGEGYDVTMITHLADGFYKDQYWDAVIGHSQGAIDALRDAPSFVKRNPHVAIIAVDPPRTSVEFRCERGARYLDLHTGEFGLGGGSLSCAQASNVAMGGLHITLPMRSDAQERILSFLTEAAPVEVADAKPARMSDLMPKRDGSSPIASLIKQDEEERLSYAGEEAPDKSAAAKPVHVANHVLDLPPRPEPAAPKTEDDVTTASITSFATRFAAHPKTTDEAKPATGTSFEARFAAPPKTADARPASGSSFEARFPPKSVSFEARFAPVWSAATNVLGDPVEPWTEHSYAGVLSASN